MNRKQKQKKIKNENIHSRQLFIYTFELSNELCRDWHTNVYFLYTFLIFATRLLSREQLCLQTEAVIDLVFEKNCHLILLDHTKILTHTHIHSYSQSELTYPTNYKENTLQNILCNKF